MYMKLIDICNQNSGNDDLSILACCLQSHGVNQLFRFLWVWSEPSEISEIFKSTVYYTDYDDCKIAGLKVRPPIEEADGEFEGCAILLIEAVCPCNVFNSDYVTVQGGEFSMKEYVICGKCACNFT